MMLVSINFEYYTHTGRTLTPVDEQEKATVGPEETNRYIRASVHTYKQLTALQFSMFWKNGDWRRTIRYDSWAKLFISDDN